MLYHLNDERSAAADDRENPPRLFGFYPIV
jgi:hypothetical protein